MSVKVHWKGHPPADREEWEDILRAEYGTAMGEIVFHLEPAAAGWRLAGVEEAGSSGAHGTTGLDQRQRFATALCAAGKPVEDAPEAESDAAEVETVTMDGLNARAERARRDGQSGE